MLCSTEMKCSGPPRRYAPDSPSHDRKTRFLANLGVDAATQVTEHFFPMTDGAWPFTSSFREPRG